MMWSDICYFGWSCFSTFSALTCSFFDCSLSSNVHIDAQSVFRHKCTSSSSSHIYRVTSHYLVHHNTWICFGWLMNNIHPFNHWSEGMFTNLCTTNSFVTYRATTISTSTAAESIKHPLYFQTTIHADIVHHHITLKKGAKNAEEFRRWTDKQDRFTEKQVRRKQTVHALVATKLFVRMSMFFHSHDRRMINSWAGPRWK